MHQSRCIKSVWAVEGVSSALAYASGYTPLLHTRSCAKKARVCEERTRGWGCQCKEKCAQQETSRKHSRDADHAIQTGHAARLDGHPQEPRAALFVFALSARAALCVRAVCSQPSGAPHACTAASPLSMWTSPSPGASHIPHVASGDRARHSAASHLRRSARRGNVDKLHRCRSVFFSRFFLLFFWASLELQGASLGPTRHGQCEVRRRGMQPPAATLVSTHARSLTTIELGCLDRRPDHRPSLLRQAQERTS